MYPGEGILGGNAATTARMPAPDESERIVCNRVGTLEETLGAIHLQIEYLENRLDTALTPAMPSTKAGEREKAPMPVMSHLCSRLVTLNEGMAAAVERLNRIRMRVEI